MPSDISTAAKHRNYNSTDPAVSYPSYRQKMVSINIGFTVPGHKEYEECKIIAHASNTAGDDRPTTAKNMLTSVSTVTFTNGMSHELRGLLKSTAGVPILPLTMKKLCASQL